MGELRLLNTGDEADASRLVEYQVGQAATQTSTVGMEMDLGFQSVDMTMTLQSSTEVTEVSDAGIVIEETMDSVSVRSSDSMVASETEAALEDLIGVTLVGTYDEHGVLQGDLERKDGQPLPPEFNTGSAEVTFPNEPIGEGASWTVGVAAEEQGFSLTMEFLYELTELTPDSYVAQISVDDDIEPQTVQGIEIEGSIKGEGEIQGDRSNPLAVQTTYRQEMDIRGGGESLSMVMTMDVQSS